MKTSNLKRLAFCGVLSIGMLSALCFSTVKVSAEDTSYLSKTYVTNSTTDDLSDAVEASNITASKIGDQKGIHPIDAGASSYIVYKISANETSNNINKLSFTLTGGRFAYYFGDFGAYFNAYISTTNAFTTANYTYTATGSAINTISYDFTNDIISQPSNEYYIKLEVAPKNPGCGYDTSWACFNSLEIKGSEAAPTIVNEDEHSYSISDLWRGTNSPSNNNAYSVTGMGGDGNATHGMIVGTWGGTLSVTEGQSGSVVYKMGNNNEILSSGIFNYTVRFTNRGNNEMHFGDRIYISASTDNQNYTLLEDIRHTNEGTKQVNQEEYSDFVDLTSYINNHNREKFIYVKIELVHLLAETADLNLWGMCLYATSVNYVTNTGYFINYDVDNGTLPENTKSNFLKTDEVYTLPTPERTGYNFINWTDTEGNTITTFDPALKQSISIKANWEIQNTTHTIGYENTFGVENTNPVTYDDKDNAIALSDIERKGYNFLGWYTALEGGDKVTSITPSEKPGDIIVYARWEEKSYSIEYILDEHITIVEQEKETKPESIKYTQTITYTIQCAEGYHLNYVKVNSKIIVLDENNIFTITGYQDKNIAIEAREYKKNNTLATSLNESFNKFETNEFTWANNVYDFSNVRIMHDSNENAGLTKVSNDIEETFIEYKFNVADDSEIVGLKLSGLARIFDFNGQDADITIKASTDNETWKTIKIYSPKSLTDGSEVVSLDYEKELAASSTYFIKVEINCTSGGNDWVVLKELSINLTTQAKEVIDSGEGEENSSSESSSEEISSEVPSSSSSESSSSETPSSTSQSTSAGKSSKTSTGGCGGEIIPTFSIVGLLTALGFVIIKKKK